MNSYLAWELLSKRASGPESFFANRLPLLRWRSGVVPPAPSFSSEATILVPGTESKPASKSVRTTEEQIEGLRCRLGSRPDAVVRSSRQLEQRIADADFDLLHYTGHMSMEHGKPAMHVGGDLFSTSRLAGIPSQSFTRKPLIFLNACATNDKTPALTGPSGWVEEFLRAGAGTFIGTNWTVRVSTADTFAGYLYDALLGNESSTLAAASAKARQSTAQQEGDWAALAYTVYGHPEATIRTS